MSELSVYDSIKHTLYEMYHKRCMGQREIAEELGVGVGKVQYRIEKYDIQKGYNSPRVVEYLYTVRDWSMRKIANHFNTGPQSVQSTCDEWNIPTRDVGARSPTGVPLHTTKNGYELWTSTNEYAHVHQLVAIADGQDPHVIFSGGEYHVHHINCIPWDNRPENLEVMSAEQHMRHHVLEREQNEEGEWVSRHE